MAGEGLRVLRTISCNPAVAPGLFSFSHVSLALERGSLLLRGSFQAPAPAAQLVWLPAPRSRHAVQLDPQPLTWTLCEPELLSGSAVVLQDFFFFFICFAVLGFHLYCRNSLTRDSPV